MQIVCSPAHVRATAGIIFGTLAALGCDSAGGANSGSVDASINGTVGLEDVIDRVPLIELTAFNTEVGLRRVIEGSSRTTEKSFRQLELRAVDSSSYVSTRTSTMVRGFSKNAALSLGLNLPSKDSPVSLGLTTGSAIRDSSSFMRSSVSSDTWERSRSTTHREVLDEVKTWSEEVGAEAGFIRAQITLKNYSVVPVELKDIKVEIARGTGATREILGIATVVETEPLSTPTAGTRTPVSVQIPAAGRSAGERRLLFALESRATDQTLDLIASGDPVSASIVDFTLQYRGTDIQEVDYFKALSEDFAEATPIVVSGPGIDMIRLIRSRGASTSPQDLLQAAFDSDVSIKDGFIETLFGVSSDFRDFAVEETSRRNRDEGAWLGGWVDVEGPLERRAYAVTFVTRGELYYDFKPADEACSELRVGPGRTDPNGCRSVEEFLASRRGEADRELGERNSRLTNSPGSRAAEAQLCLPDAGPLLREGLRPGDMLTAEIIGYGEVFDVTEETPQPPRGVRRMSDHSLGEYVRIGEINPVLWDHFDAHEQKLLVHDALLSPTEVLLATEFSFQPGGVRSSLSAALQMGGARLQIGPQGILRVGFPIPENATSNGIADVCFWFPAESESVELGRVALRSTDEKPIPPKVMIAPPGWSPERIMREVIARDPVSPHDLVRIQAIRVSLGVIRLPDDTVPDDTVRVAAPRR